MNRRKIGTENEQRAISFLQETGYEILETNYYTRHGEIDIIAKEGRYLVFVEVKYRSQTEYGSPFEAITIQKQRHIVSAARYFLYRQGYPEDMPCRFDAVGIYGETITLLKDAFEAE